MTLQELKATYPQYKDIPDGQLADALHAKYYSDIPKRDFYSKIGFNEKADLISTVEKGYKQNPRLFPSPEQLRSGDDKNAFNNDGALLRGLNSIGDTYSTIYDVVKSKITGEPLTIPQDRQIRTQAIEATKKLQNYNSTTPERQAEIDKVDRSGSVLRKLWDTVTHPGEWTATGVYENLLDPANIFIPGGSSIGAKVAGNIAKNALVQDGKATTKAIVGTNIAKAAGGATTAGATQAPIGYAQGYANAKNQGASDDEAMKAALEGAGVNALIGGTLGGIHAPFVRLDDKPKLSTTMGAELSQTAAPTADDIAKINAINNSDLIKKVADVVGEDKAVKIVGANSKLLSGANKEAKDTLGELARTIVKDDYEFHNMGDVEGTEKAARAGEYNYLDGEGNPLFAKDTIVEKPIAINKEIEAPLKEVNSSLSRNDLTDRQILFQVSKDAPFEEKLKDIRESLSRIDRNKLKPDEQALYDFAVSQKNFVEFIKDGVRSILNKGDDKSGFKHIILRHYGEGADGELSHWDLLRIAKTIKEGTPLSDAEIAKIKAKAEADGKPDPIGNKTVLRRYAQDGSVYYAVLGKDAGNNNVVVTYYRSRVFSKGDSPKSPVEYSKKTADGYGDLTPDTISQIVSQTNTKSQDIINGMFQRFGKHNVITLFKGADPVTLFHEYGHYLRSTLSKDELAHAKEVFGDFNSKNEKVRVKAEEDFAHAFVKYLATQEAPTTKLKGIFEKIKAVLQDFLREYLPEMKHNLTPGQIDFFKAILGDKEAGAKVADNLEAKGITLFQHTQPTAVEKLKDKVEAIKANTVLQSIKDGFTSIKDEGYLRARDARAQGLQKDFTRIEQLHKALATLTPYTRSEIHQYLSGDKKIADLSDPIQNFANNLRHTIDSNTQQLVEMKLLSQQTADELKNYVRRIYADKWADKQDGVRSQAKTVAKMFARGTELTSNKPDEIIGFINDYLKAKGEKPIEYAMNLDEVKAELKNRGLLADSIHTGKLVWSDDTVSDRKKIYDSIKAMAGEALSHIDAQGGNIHNMTPSEILSHIEGYKNSKYNARDGFPMSDKLFNLIKDELNKIDDNRKVTLKRDWTQQERAAMGEIMDSALTIPNTLVRQHMMLENAKFLKEVAGNKAIVSDVELDGYEQVPMSDKYGALKGKWVDKKVFNDIKSLNENLFGGESPVWDAYKKGLSFWKEGKTVLSPTAHLNNFVSNNMMIYTLRPSAFKYYKQVVDIFTHAKEYDDLKIKELTGALSGEQKARIQELEAKIKPYLEAKELGVFGRSELQDILANYKIGEEYGAQNAAMSALQRIRKGAQRVYQNGDAIPRMALYMSYLEDPKMTPSMAKELVTSLMPDYSKPLPPYLKILRDTGISPFISWTYFAIPAFYKAVKSSKAASARFTALIVGAGLYSALSFDDAPDEFIGRRLPFSTDEDGNVRTIKVDRMIPMADLTLPLTDMAAKIIKGANNGELGRGINEGLNAAGQGYFNYLKQLGLAGGLPIDIIAKLNNYDFYNGRNVAQKGADYVPLKIGEAIVETLAPTPVATAKSAIMQALQDTETRRRNSYIEPRDAYEIAAQLLGINTLRYNPEMVKRKETLDDIRYQRKMLEN